MALENLPSHKRYLDQTLNVYLDIRPPLNSRQLREMLNEEATKLRPPLSPDDLTAYFIDKKLYN